MKFLVSYSEISEAFRRIFVRLPLNTFVFQTMVPGYPLGQFHPKCNKCYKIKENVIFSLKFSLLTQLNQFLVTNN